MEIKVLKIRNVFPVYGMLICFLWFGSIEVLAKKVEVSSLEEFAHYARLNGNTVVLEPGVYSLANYLNSDSIEAKLRRKDYQYFNFSGSNNVFVMNGVHWELDTELRKKLKHPIHTSEIVVSGNNNTLTGLKINCQGNTTSPGGAVFEVAGEGNTIHSFFIHVQGSFPYGYGDLFGKGGPDVIRHQKHSGFLVRGSNTRVVGCTLQMRSFGHGFYIQNNVENIHFEDCLVEGEMRSTDDILKEESGPAFDVEFRTWTPNRAGEYVVTPGYMKSLCEDGFRTYGGIKNVSFKNCTSKNTRGGFELRTNRGIKLENCTTIGTERAYWIGDGAIVKNCRGDANYGPLIFIEGSNVEVEMTVMPAESDRKVHALATIQGSNNTVTFKSYKGETRDKPLSILVGYTHPEHGESMSPYGEGPCVNLELINKTTMPIILGEKVINCRIETAGKILENHGERNSIKGL